ncbi:hypothetical protein RVS70_05630 [Virgibacillus sp. M23]|uniref:hypothetical protein n=1 Tax=Virgibacillus sp. M23 TaxID=3079030 RepID=UPI002A91F0D4|nr:hypothetical protein [Virgibacillus sp. M23]MDY7043681.1 hypothetical protein [Virgibacillus sp. M23]
MGYVRLDKIKSTAHIETIVANQDLVNGQFVALGQLQADGEARSATPSGDQAEELVFHASVPLTYEDRTNELDFVLKAGKEGRGYVLEQGDIVSVSEDLIAVGELAENAIVVPHADGFAVTSEPTTGLHGKIIAVETDMIAGKLAVIRLGK